MSAESQTTESDNYNVQATTFDASDPSKANAQTNTLLGSEFHVSLLLAPFAY